MEDVRGGLFEISKIYFGSLKDGADRSQYLKKKTKITILKEQSIEKKAILNKIYLKIDPETKIWNPEKPKKRKPDSSIYLDIDWIDSKGKTKKEPHLIHIGSLQNFTSVESYPKKQVKDRRWKQ